MHEQMQHQLITNHRTTEEAKLEETIVGLSGLMSLLEHFAHTAYLVKVLTFCLKFSYQLPIFQLHFPFPPTPFVSEKSIKSPNYQPFQQNCEM